MPAACDLRYLISEKKITMTFDSWMRSIVHGFAIAGVAILVLGAVVVVVRAFAAALAKEWTSAYESARRTLGRVILLGLEFLIVADIVLTITVDPTLESAVSLGLIVVVRTFLSFSLEIELDGCWPWQRSRHEARSADSRPTAAE